MRGKTKEVPYRHLRESMPTQVCGVYIQRRRERERS